MSQIRFGLDTAADDAGLSPIQPHMPSPVADPSTRLADFRQLTNDDVRELISFSPNKSYCLDPIPTEAFFKFSRLSDKSHSQFISLLWNFPQCTETRFHLSPT